MKDYVFDAAARCSELPRPLARQQRSLAPPLGVLAKLLRVGETRRRMLGFTDRARAGVRRLRSEKARMSAELDATAELYAELEMQNAELAELNQRLRAQLAEMTESLARSETRAAALSLRVKEAVPDAAAEKRRRAEREAWGEVSLENLAAYMDTYYPEALLMTRRAEQGLRRSLYANPDLVRRCLEILATDYRRRRLGGETGAHPRYLAELAKLGVGEAVTGSRTVATHRDAYTVSVDGRNRILDRHLRKGLGEDETTLFRLYFCWDAETSRVIVGHLTTHLPTVQGGYG